MYKYCIYNTPRYILHSAAGHNTVKTKWDIISDSLVWENYILILLLLLFALNFNSLNGKIAMVVKVDIIIV